MIPTLRDRWSRRISAEFKAIFGYRECRDSLDYIVTLSKNKNKTTKLISLWKYAAFNKLLFFLEI